MAPAALAASPLRSEAANAAEELIVLLVLIKVRFLSPPYSNCCGSTCLTDVGTEGVLIIQGLNMAATQAAADALFDAGIIQPVLQKAKLPHGALRPFELLIETTSVGAAAPGVRIVATRIYP